MDTYNVKLTRDELYTICEALLDDEKRLYENARKWEKRANIEMERTCYELAETRFNLRRKLASITRRF